MFEKKPWRVIKPGPPISTHPDDAPELEPTMIMDGIAYVGDEFTGTFVIQTEVGLVMFDCMFPRDKDWRILTKGFKKLGFNFEDVKAIIITHGHADHYGCYERIKEISNCTVYMNMIDWDIATKPSHFKPMEVRPDVDLKDVDVLEFGSLKIKCYHTPGHTQGSMSFIFNVTDEGREHKASIWGGSGVSIATEETAAQYIASADRFSKISEEEGVDVIFSTHQFQDGGKGKMDAIHQVKTTAVHNPYVVGREGALQFETYILNSGKKALQDAINARNGVVSNEKKGLAQFN